MAIINFCGFEIGLPVQLNADNNNSAEPIESDSTGGVAGTVQSTIVNPGGSKYALQFQNPNAVTYFELSRPNGNLLNSSVLLQVNDLYARFYIYIGTLPGADWPFIQSTTNITNSGSVKFQLILTSAGILKIKDNAGTVTSGATTLTTGVWHIVQVHVGTGASGATLEVTLDNRTEISTTGNTTTSQHGALQIGNLSTSVNSTGTMYFDDIEMRDNGYPGRGVVVCLRPNANGHYQSWAGGNKTDYTAVNDLARQTGNDGSSTYVADNGTTNKFSVQCQTLEGLVPVIQSINAVKAIVVAGSYNSQGGVSSAFLRVNGTDSSAVQISLGAPIINGWSWTYSGRFDAINPVSSAAWAASDVDNTEIGIVNVTVNSNIGCTEMALMVSVVPGIPQIVRGTSLKTTPHGSGLWLPKGFVRRAETGYAIQERTGYGCQPVWSGLFADAFNYSATMGSGHDLTFGPYYKNKPGNAADTIWTANFGIVSPAGSGSTIYLGCASFPTNVPNQMAALVLQYSSGPAFNPGSELIADICFDSASGNAYAAQLFYASNSDNTNWHFHCLLIKNGFTEASGDVFGLVQHNAQNNNQAANFPVQIAIKSEFAGGVQNIYAYFAFLGSPLNLNHANDVFFGTSAGGAGGAVGTQNVLGFVDNSSPLITGAPGVGGSGGFKASYFLCTAA